MHNNVAVYRKSRGLSQEDLARAIGKARSTLATYEIGQIDIPVSAILRISDVLGVTVDELLRNREEVRHDPVTQTQ